MKQRNMIYAFKKKTKYGNISCFRDGIRFDSRKEAEYYDQLKLELRAKVITFFERQVDFDLFAWDPSSPESAEGKRVCCHRVDFLVTYPDGSKEVREVKGFATDVWNLKRKLFEANYPEINYKVVR